MSKLNFDSGIKEVETLEWLGVQNFFKSNKRGIENPQNLIRKFVGMGVAVGFYKVILG